LGIGIEGGFSDPFKKYRFESTFAIVLLPSFTTFPYPDDKLPLKISEIAEAIINAESQEMKVESSAWNLQDDIKESIFARHLVQINSGLRIPPTGWKCASCDLTTNLWINLSDGYIGCGRKQLDGSGGNEHALNHYRETQFPLAVKLGTITGEGADVYSYAMEESDMVIDPLLETHLAHFGINMREMKKDR